MHATMIHLEFVLFAFLAIAPLFTTQQGITVLPFVNVSDNASVFTGVDDSAREFDFPLPFYFNGKPYINAFISSNGYVSFGQGYSEYVPRPFPLFISSSNSTFTTAPTIVPSIISPYWDDIDLTTTGNILYESYDESDSTDLNLLKTISNFITDSQNLTKIFECKSAVVVFWSNVCPFGDNNCNDTNSFQVVLASDEDTSYAVFIYKCGLLRWSVHGAGIGYDDGEDFFENYDNSNNSNSSINDIACLNDPNSPWSNVVYKLNEEPLSISPPYGHIFGGVAVLVSGPTFKGDDILYCIFGGIEVEATYISAGYASCVSPRLFNSTGVTFNIKINNAIYEYSTVYYPLPLEELGEATIEERTLLFEVGNSITVGWNPSDILRSVGGLTDDNIELDVKLIELNQDMNTHREIAILASNIPNSGSATVRIDGLDQSDSEVWQVSVFIEARAIRTQIANTSLSRSGVWTGIFFVTLSGIGRSLCDQWASTEPISIGQEILDRVRSQFPCPPTLAQARRSNSNLQPDNRLIFFYHPNAENCFRQADGTEQSTGGYGNQCCYDDNGNLIVGPSSGGTVDKVSPSKSMMEHFKEDVIPFLLCCKGMFRNCQTYYDRRPSDNGTAYRPFVPACWFGDPHIVTLDLHNYTFNGKGEYILIETVDNSFTVQGRMVEATNSFGNPISTATVFSAIVIKQNESDTVQFELFYQQLIVLVNGERIDFDDVLTEQMFNNVTISKQGNNTLTATFSRGENIKLVEQNGILSVMLVNLPRSYIGKTRGLMGSNDGNATNDLVPRNEDIPLPLNSTIESIHTNFGVSWIVEDPSDSLFTYLSGGDWSSYYSPTFTPRFNVFFNNPSLEAEAIALCGDDQFCIFDVAATGRLDIGASTLQTGLDFLNLIELSKPIICDPLCANGACVANDTCACSEGYNGTLCDILVYTECEENPCQNNGECLFHAGSYICTCNSESSGEYCENELKGGSGNSVIVIAASVSAAIVVIVLIAIIVFVIVALFYKRRTGIV